MLSTVFFILFITVAIICFSSVVAINKIIFKHGNEVFAFKNKTGKIYRRKILWHFIYALLTIVGFLLIALLVTYMNAKINGKAFKVHY